LLAAALLVVLSQAPAWSGRPVTEEVECTLWGGQVEDLRIG
jgi:hypothetical protein